MEMFCLVAEPFCVSCVSPYSLFLLSNTASDRSSDMMAERYSAPLPRPPSAWVRNQIVSGGQPLDPRRTQLFLSLFACGYFSFHSINTQSHQTVGRSTKPSGHLELHLFYLRCDCPWITNGWGEDRGLTSQRDLAARLMCYLLEVEVDGRLPNLVLSLSGRDQNFEEVVEAEAW